MSNYRVEGQPSADGAHIFTASNLAPALRDRLAALLAPEAPRGIVEVLARPAKLSFVAVRASGELPQVIVRVRVMTRDAEHRRAAAAKLLHLGYPPAIRLRAFEVGSDATMNSLIEHVMAIVGDVFRCDGDARLKVRYSAIVRKPIHYVMTAAALSAVFIPPIVWIVTETGPAAFLVEHLSDELPLRILIVFASLSLGMFTAVFPIVLAARHLLGAQLGTPKTLDDRDL